jgi:uncharacterized protein YndB with AHSA1/START domain
MAKYDVTDETVIDAEPEAVFGALVDVFDGRVNWWLPHLSSKLRAGSSMGAVGGYFDVTVHTMIPLRWTGQTMHVERPAKVHVHYIKGAFTGEALWTFERLENGTRLRLRWQADPASLTSKLASRFIAVGKAHSQVMHKGFANLAEYLKSQARAAKSS